MLKKRNILLAAALLVLWVSGLTSQGATPVGSWKTIDDETGEMKSVVTIWDYQGKLYGRIDQLIRKPGEDPNPLCDKCTGANFNKPVKGLMILGDLSKNGNEWSGGWIMDPKNGKVYGCKMTLIEGGAKLQVRGFMGFSLLGRNQIWHRQ